MKRLVSIRFCLLSTVLAIGLLGLIAGAVMARGAAREAGQSVAHTPRPFAPSTDTSAAVPRVWQHLSSATGDLPAPEGGDQQVAALAGDLNGDGLNDFVIAARKPPGPSIHWYERQSDGWIRHVIETEVLPVEAGGALQDLDADGDLDLVLGGNGQSNGIWWWENPHPAVDERWTRHTIKSSGNDRHHDLTFGQFDDDPAVEFVYWNQGASGLYIVDVPDAGRVEQPWPNARPILAAPSPRYEGLAKADINGDGRMDIVAGGRWLEYVGDSTYTAHVIDNMDHARIAVGQLKPGGWPEVVMSSGDAVGPARWFEWDGSTWVGHDLFEHNVKHAHSLEVGDVDGDGLLDIFIAEMAFHEADSKHNPEAKAWVLYGDGQGGFTSEVVSSGFDHHESRLVDLDGNGTLDILGKPFSWQTPRVDIWLNAGPGDECGPGEPLAGWTWQRHLIDPNRPGRAAFVFPFDVDGDGRIDFVTGKFWYANPGTPAGAWERNPLATPIEDVIAAHDFDGDGDLDLLATTGATLPNDEGYWWPVIWARNEGGGQFTPYDNLDASGVKMPPNDPIQGVAIARFTADGPLEVALTWDDTEQPNRNPYGVQVFTVPDDPTSGVWARRQLSDVSVGEELTASDLDGDGDLDLFMGNKWLRNEYPAASWTPIDIFPVLGRQQTSRHYLRDMDGDGDQDAIIGFSHSPKDRSVAWYEHPADPTVPWPAHLIGMLERGSAESMDAVDLDGDGDVDVVAGEYTAHYTTEQPGASLWIFENLGGGEWARRLIHKGDSHYQSSRAVDIDGDGDFDILAKGWFKNEVYLYENTTPPGCGD